MKNKIAAVVLAATMIGTAVMPAANVFAAKAVENEEVVTVDEDETKDIVVKDDAAEADFEGVWRLSSLHLFGEAMNAGEYGMDASFITIQDGKMDIYSAPMYGEETDVKGIDMTVENGKYVVNLDENLVNNIENEFLTFSTHAIQLLADPSSDSEIEAAKEAASTADDVMLYDDKTAEDADTETTDEDATVNA